MQVSQGIGIISDIGMKDIIKRHILDIEPYRPGRPVDEVRRESAAFRGAFGSWTVAETFVLNRYRKRAE